MRLLSRSTTLSSLLARTFPVTRVLTGQDILPSPLTCDLLIVNGGDLKDIPSLDVLRGPRTVVFGPKCESNTHFYTFHYLYHPTVENVVYLSSLNMSEYDLFPNPKKLINPRLKVFIAERYFETVKRLGGTRPYVEEFDDTTLTEVLKFVKNKSSSETG